MALTLLTFGSLGLQIFVAPAQESLTFTSSSEQHGPVKGLPYQAVRMTKVVKTLPDGTPSTMEF
jgi:hypothetical protein